MTNQDQKYKTLTDKSRSHKKAKFMNSDTVSQTDSQRVRQTDRQTGRAIDKIVLFFEGYIASMGLYFESISTQCKKLDKKISKFTKDHLWLTRLVVIRTDQATDRVN